MNVTTQVQTTNGSYQKHVTSAVNVVFSFNFHYHNTVNKLLAANECHKKHVA